MKAFLSLAALCAIAAPRSFAAPALTELRAFTAAPPAAIPGISVPVFEVAGTQKVNDDWLLEMSQSKNVLERYTAAKSLRSYKGQSRVGKRLREMASDKKEDYSVRQAAIYSLSWNTNSKDEAVLTKIVWDRRENDGLKASAIQALYWKISKAPNLRKKILRILESRNEKLDLRLAAAWSLMASSQDRDTAKRMLRVVNNNNNPQSVRDETLISLYSGTGHRAVREGILAIALGRKIRRGTDFESDDRERQKIAIITLQGANQDRDVRESLQTLAKRSKDDQISAQVIEALAKTLSEELLDYFHLSHYRGEYRDPLP